MVYCFLQARSIIPYKGDYVNSFFEKNKKICLSVLLGKRRTERQCEEDMLSRMPSRKAGGINTAANRQFTAFLLMEQKDAEPYCDTL